MCPWNQRVLSKLFPTDPPVRVRSDHEEAVARLELLANGKGHNSAVSGEKEG